MPTSFTSVTDGVTTIQAAQLNQYASPVNNLEKGAALYVTEDGASVADVYVVVPDPPAPDPLTAGYHLRMLVSNANTGASSIDVGTSDNAVAIKKRGGSALASGDLPAGLIADLVFDGTDFELQNPAASGGGASALDDLTDVAITAAASGDLLRHNGTAWVDATPADAGLVETSRTITAGSGLTGGGDLSANRTLAVDIAGLTADGTPDGAADYVMTYDASAGANKKVLLEDLPGGGGATTFLGLTDTPAAYTSQANKVVAVKGDETGLEFVAPTTPTLPTTTKGDLIVDDGVDVDRLPVGTNGQVLTADSAEALGVKWATPSGGSGTVLPSVCTGRLTLTTGVPVTTADVTAASTLYFAPYLGNQVALYNGSAWAYHTLTERSLALSGLTSGKNYDVFIYDNAGTLTLELSAAWTNDTTRADALATQDGVHVKSGATTRRYLGTIRTTGTTTTEDSNAKRFVWNLNAVPRVSATNDSTSSWTHTSTTPEAVNGGNAAWKHEFLLGLAHYVVESKWAVQGNSGGAYGRFGMGLDRSSSASNAQDGDHTNTTMSTNLSVGSNYVGLPGVGYHYLQALCWTDSGTVTLYGNPDSTIGGYTMRTKLTG